MQQLAAMALIFLFMLAGALAGYVAARLAKLDAKLVAAIGALVGFAFCIVMIVETLRSP